MSFTKTVKMNGKTKIKKFVNVKSKLDSQLFIPVLTSDCQIIPTYVGPDAIFTVPLKTYKQNKDKLSKLKDNARVDKITKVITRIGKKKTTAGRTDFSLTVHEGKPGKGYKEGKKHKDFKLAPGAIDPVLEMEKAKVQKAGEEE